MRATARQISFADWELMRQRDQGIRLEPLLGYLGYPFFGIAVASYAAIVLMLIARQNLLELLSQAEK